MNSWNLRTIILLRSLAMVVLPLWFLIYQASLPGAFVWLILWGLISLIIQKLDKAAKVQMDECAQLLLDRLSQNVEWLTFVLVAIAIIFLTQIPRAEDPGAMALVAARILAWGLFGIHLYRGITFWIRDWTGSRC